MSDDKEKSLYLKQIGYLDEQLDRCQLRCDELVKQNNSLVSQCSSLKTDKKDVTEYLKHSLAAKQKEVEEVLEQLKEAEEDREALKMQLKEQVEELKSHNMMQALELEQLKEQHDTDMNSQKEQHEAEIRSLEEQHEATFISLKEQHGAAFNSQKMDAASERAKITLEAQKNMQVSLKQRVSEILQEQVAQHNKKMEQLEFLLKENMVLWKEKDRLHELCSKTEEDLINVTQKSLSCEKEVEQLSIKNQQLREKLKDCSFNLQLHQDMLLKKEAHLVKERQRLSEQHRQKAAEADQLGAELEEERSRRRRLEAVMQEAVIILRHILKESEKTAETERKMQRLLDILESSAPLATGSTPQVTGSTCVGRQGQQSSGPRSVRAETLKLSTDPMFLLSKYRPGDLGLVPRPRWEHKPTASEAAAAQLGSNRLPSINRSNMKTVWTELEED